MMDCMVFTVISYGASFSGLKAKVKIETILVVMYRQLHTCFESTVIRETNKPAKRDNHLSLCNTQGGVHSMSVLLLYADFICC